MVVALTLSAAVLIAYPALPSLAAAGKPPAKAAAGEMTAEAAGKAEEHHGYRHLDGRALTVQIFGFAVLAFILLRYVKDPVAQALEARRTKIRETFEGFEKQEKETADAQANAEYGLREVERGAAARLDEAASEGAALRDQLIAEGEQYAARVKERVAIDEELGRQTTLLLLKNRMIDLSLRAAEETLRQGVDRPTHDGIVDKFLDDIVETVKEAQARAQGQKAEA